MDFAWWECEILPWQSDFNHLVPPQKVAHIHGDVGCKLNDLLIDLCMNEVVGNVTKRYDNITPNIDLEETNITNILDVMKKLQHDMSFVMNHIKSQDSNLKIITCDIGVQTDLNSVLSENIIQNQACLPRNISELTAELEGVKLVIVINEAKTINGIHTNSQAIEQIRIDLKDQNKSICDKVEALKLSLQECKVNLHTNVQKHSSNCLNQRCVTSITNTNQSKTLLATNMHKSASSLFSPIDDILDEPLRKIDEAPTGIRLNNDYVDKQQLTRQIKELTSERVNEANSCTALDESVVLINCKNQGNQQRHYNLGSPVKQSNFHQHSQTVPRPQPNISRVEVKTKN